MVKRVERLSEGDPESIGAVDRMTFVGRLPYRRRRLGGVEGTYSRVE
ncbi:MAG TPA: hypothetical protein VNL94_08610 [Candidatus Binatia bacterium]|nr:hypothetical protein [Candidatus Binatia bacterium]